MKTNKDRGRVTVTREMTDSIKKRLGTITLTGTKPVATGLKEAKIPVPEEAGEVDLALVVVAFRETITDLIKILQRMIAGATETQILLLEAAENVAVKDRAVSKAEAKEGRAEERNGNHRLGSGATERATEVVKKVRNQLRRNFIERALARSFFDLKSFLYVKYIM